MYKVIIVDDEIRILRQLEKIIPWQDVDFKLAGTFRRAADALEFLSNNPVDLILTDIKMPEISGLDLVKICSENYPNIKIIILSAYNDFTLAQEAIRYGVNDYITKPVSIEKITDALKRVSAKISSSQKIFSDEYIVKKQKYFYDMYKSAKITLELRKALENLHIYINPVDFTGKIISFDTEGIKNYITNKWSHDPKRFIFAVASIMTQETKHAYYSIISENIFDIKIISISKPAVKPENFSNDVKNTTDELLANLSELLNLDITITFKELERASDATFQKNEAVESAKEYINENLKSDLSLDSIASYVCLNTTYFSSLFKKYTNETINDYITRIRIEKAKKLLEVPNLKINNIAYEVGFNSTSYFHRVFKSETGYSPNEYKSLIKRNE